VTGTPAVSTVQVKICGVVRPEDALVAAEAGADAVGLILVPSSPRSVAPDEARVVVRAAGALCCVGVFVNRPPADVARVADVVGLDIVQLHGQEDPAVCRKLAAALGPGRVLKAIRFKHRVDYGVLRRYADEGIPLLVDGPFGGGPLDWCGLKDWQRRMAVPLVLAGGLNPENVAEAVRIVAPVAVDTARGVEMEGEPRRKDPQRIRRFVAAAKAAGAPPSGRGAVVFRKVES